jgi:tetratricopeptide (TPR) repeat protein
VIQVAAFALEDAVAGLSNMVKPIQQRRRVLALALLIALPFVVGVIYLRLTRYPSVPEYDRVVRVQPPQREGAVRRVVPGCPVERRPALLRRVADLAEGQQLALQVVLTTMATDPANAGPVLEEYRDIFPDDPTLPASLIRLRLEQGKSTEAVRIYHEYAARLAGNETARRGLVYYFIESMMLAEKPLEAYTEVEQQDLAYAFSLIGEHLAGGCTLHDPTSAVQLRALIAEHNRRAGPDPTTIYYVGVAADGEEDREAAQRAYAAAMLQMKSTGYTPHSSPANSPIDAKWTNLLHRRVYDLWWLGRWEEAYDECEPTDKVYRNLSELLASPEDTNDLERLLTWDRTRRPADPMHSYWQAIIYWNRGQYEKAIPQFQAYLASGAFPGSNTAWEAENELFRCFVRLDRLDEARAALQDAKAKGRTFYPLAETIVAAKTGNTRFLDDRFTELSRNFLDPFRGSYEDEDLGPLLMGDRFADLRKKYPRTALRTTRWLAD